MTARRWLSLPIAIATLLIIPVSARCRERAEIFPQLGQAGEVTCVAFSPDGRMVVSGGVENAVTVWDAASGRELKTLQGHTYPVLGVAVSPDGKLIASGSTDDTIKLWDLETGRLLRTLTGHSAAVTSVSFSPDGRLLASGSADKTVKVWDAARGVALQTLTGHQDGVQSVAFAPDGQTIVSGGQDKLVKVWSVKSGQALRTLMGHDNWVMTVAVSPDGKLIASASLDSTIGLWDLASGRKLGALSLDGSPVKAVSFSPDGETLASGGWDGALKLWDLADRHLRRSLKGHDLLIMGLAFSADGKEVATGSADRRIKLWDVADARDLRTLSGHAGWMDSVSFSPDGRLLASGGWDKLIHLWDRTSGQQMRVFKGHQDHVGPVAFSPNGSVLASGGDDKLIKLWDVLSGHEVRTLTGHTDKIDRLVFSPDGQILASASEDKTVKLWNTANGTELRTLAGHTELISSIAFSPDGKMLASSSYDHTVRLWDVATGAPLGVLKGDDKLTFIAFSPDGATLALSAGGRIDLWAVSSRQKRRGWACPSPICDNIAFSPDGDTLASGGVDSDIVLWDVASGRPLRTLVGHKGDIPAVAFSPDGGVLASASWDGTLRLWDVRSGRQRAALVGFEDGDWIAITPEGFFESSSAAAEEDVNVRIGQRVFGIASFRDNFYRPDLVGLSLAGRTLASYGAVDRVKLSPVVEMAMASPTVTTDSITLTVRLTDSGGGIGPIRVFHNGSVVLQDAAAPRTGAVTRAYKIPLFDGANTLRVAAFNSDGSMWSEAVSAVEAHLPQATDTKGVLHALVIGIKDFPKRPDEQLTYPVADAQLLADTLKRRSVRLFKTLDISMLTTPDQTDKASVIKALKAMQKTVEPEDEFVLYIASHGTVVDNQYYLITSNVDATSPEGLKTQAISAPELSALLANITAVKKLVIIDTCDAGSAGDALARSQTTGGLSDQAAVTILGRDTGLTVLAATKSDQDALEGGYKDHGLFTWAVAEGLDGKAADQDSGLVSTFKLADFVDGEVPQLAQMLYKRDQQPTTTKSGQSFSVSSVR